MADQSPGKFRILVIDDNEMSRRLIEFPLQRDGHEIIHADSGGRALALLKTEEVDLIFLDLVMEDMDGREVLEALQSDNRLRDIPVVIVTGIEDADIASECVAAGASEFLYKPATAASLRELVGNLVQRKDTSDGTTRAGVPDTDVDDVSVLDPKNIQQLRSDYDDTVTAGFIGRFQELSVKQSETINSASASGELAVLERAAHDLKGGARTLGLNRLAATCRNIELASRQGQLDSVRQGVASLSKYYKEARSALKDFARVRGLED